MNNQNSEKSDTPIDFSSNGGNVPQVERNDRVNHPSHYTWLKGLCGIEVIDITRHMDFNLGNCIKYILRAGKKNETGMSDIDKCIEDLKRHNFTWWTKSIC